MLLEGLFLPLTTPFRRDGQLNPHKLSANVARYSKTPAAGLIVLGPHGEPTLLSDDETRTSMRAAAETAAPEKVLIAGISRDSVAATLTLAEAAATLHYDAILLGLPSILTVEPGLTGEHASTPRLRETLLYFQAVADRSPLPIVLFSSAAPNCCLTTETIAELAHHPNLLGLLDADPRAATRAQTLLQQTFSVSREVPVTQVFAAVTARMRKASAATGEAAHLISAATLTGNSTATAIAAPPAATPAARTRTRKVGFQILACATTSLLDALQSGAAGIAPAFAACAPQACYEVFAAWKDQDLPLAAEKQARLLDAARLAEDLGPGGLKFGADLNGYFGGWPRAPLLPPTAAQRAELEEKMKPLRS